MEVLGKQTPGNGRRYSTSSELVQGKYQVITETRATLEAAQRINPAEN